MPMRLCSAGKDVFWYAKEKQEHGDAVQEELNMVKAREEELMLEVSHLCTTFVQGLQSMAPTLHEQATKLSHMLGVHH